MIHRERLPFAPPAAYAAVFVFGLVGLAGALALARLLPEGDRPPLAFDLAMLLGVGVWVFAGISFRALEVVAGPDGIVASFGPLRRRIPRARIDSAQVAPYGALAYGGYGWRLAIGKEAWSVLGARTGVELRVRRRKGGTRTVFVSSEDPEGVLRALGLPHGGGGPASAG